MKFYYYYIIALFTLSSCQNNDESDLNQNLRSNNVALNQKENTLSLDNLDIHKSDWMSLISDQSLLKNISLVGSHDAGAYRYGGGLTICQQDDIYTQLQKGVRYLDIRLNYVDGDLVVYHGIISQKLSFEKDVLAQVSQFLDEHPSEGIFMILKNENGENQTAWENALMKVINSKPKLFKKFITTSTKLSELRGKIAVISRSGLDEQISKMRGIAYDDSVFGSLNNESMYFSDDFKVSNLLSKAIDEKANILFDALDKARLAQYENSWFIINCNGTSAFAYPYDVAYRINPKLKDYLINHTFDNNQEFIQRNGFLVLDFTTSDKGQDIVDLIIQSSIKANPISKD